MFEHTPEDQYVDVGSIHTRYWTLGGEGPPVLLIHGIGASMESWAANVGALAGAHRVYALDLVGSGYTEKPEAPYSLSYLAQFVADFMETVDLARASIVGHSLGGGVTLKLALEHAEKVKKMVLVASAGLGHEGHIFFKLASLPLIGELLTRPTSREGVAQSLETFYTDPSLVTEERVDLSYDLLSQPGYQRAYLSMVRSLATVFGARKSVIRSIVDHLDEIKAPTLVVWGEEDNILSVKHAQVAAEGIPNARLHIFEDSGHMVPEEKPETFNDLVLAFLDNEATQGGSDA